MKEEEKRRDGIGWVLAGYVTGALIATLLVSPLIKDKFLDRNYQGPTSVEIYHRPIISRDTIYTTTDTGKIMTGTSTFVTPYYDY